MVGTLEGTDTVFQRAYGNPVSAHYGVALDGRIHQYVSLDDGAWANGGPNPGWRWPFGVENPNHRTISIETEDNGHPDTEPVSEAQYNAVVSLYRAVVQPRWPGITRLVAHRVINPGHSCPAQRWLSGRFQQLGDELGLEVLV